MKQLQYYCQAIIVYACSVGFNVVFICKLFLMFINNWRQLPWTVRQRPEPPQLSDPKYGVHKYANVNGIRLHYVESGDKRKPLMVFVHGFPEFWYCWRHQIEEFSKDFWVIAFDMRGYNQSEKPSGVQNYRIQYMVDDLRALIEYLNRKKFILVAHDWGAVISWQFVAQNKSMVYKFICMGGPSSKVFRQLLRKTEQIKKSWYMIAFQMPVVPELMLTSQDFNIFDDMWDGVTDSGFTKDDMEVYKYAFSHDKEALTGGMNYYRANLLVNTDDLPKERDMDGSNGMFLMGSEEKYISLESVDITIKEYPKIRAEIVKGANHFLMQHKPAEVNRLIREFLGDAHRDCSTESFN